jgi:hypothetical protein
MQLTSKQISKIYKKIELTKGKQILMIDVSEDKKMPTEESNFNIYCVDEQYNIIWQVKESKTKPIDAADMFVYLGKDVHGEIIADRFSGFTYKIDPETGEAMRTGFHK